jgi:H+/Cl- antiporter ClcA
MLQLSAMKIVATAFCTRWWCGGSSRHRSFIGAMLGGSIVTMAHEFLPGSTIPVGAFALFGWVRHSLGSSRPNDLVLIDFEMTAVMTLNLPLMIANLTSNLLARRCSPCEYEAMLTRTATYSMHASPGDQRETLPY